MKGILWGLVASALSLATSAHAQAPTLIPASNPAAALVGQTITGVCGYSGVPFSFRVERADSLTTLDGVPSTGAWLPIVVTAWNTGNKPHDAYLALDLTDGSGRTFTEAGSSDGIGYPHYSNTVKLYRAKDEVTDIQPGLSAQILFVFQVPTDVTSLALASDQTCS